ncbi:MAG: hypothetical protein LBR93_10945, partial [Treponema sp.]|nr:hypothetical protein [Treponema sp.]
ADLVFENITVTGGNTSTGNGGGIYISGNSKVKFSGGSITRNTARSGGGVYVEDSNRNDQYDFTLLNGSITGNTATDTATNPIAGGGGIYTNRHALVWFAGGTVSDNITAGSGGGILVNGMAYDKNNTSSLTGTERGNEYGLLMSGGTISGNRSNGNASPHGGGGVYVAKGVFEMLGGEINGINSSLRQGGGVFVWHNARFSASGTSSITGNQGVGSSKGICSRGYTEMMGRAQADKIYIWNNNPVSEGSFSAEPDSFTLAENARAVGIVLAYDDTPTSPQTRNFISFTDTTTPGSDQVCLIDLEGHLTNYQFKETELNNDWVGKKILEVDSSATENVIRQRFPLNTFVGGSTITLKGKYYLKKTSGGTTVSLSSTP